MESINSQIVRISKSYLNIKEIGDNQAFDDKVFEQKLIGLGWEKGWAYCALTGKLIWMESYVAAGYSNIAANIGDLMTPSAVKTWSNFVKSDFITDQKPEVGALIIWQKYKLGSKTWMGHMGIVLEVNGPYDVVTFEGNTNQRGSREGQGNLEKTRNTELVHKNGLNLLGYVHPKTVEVL